MTTEKKAEHTYNLHTHTYRCKHAEGDMPEYAARAVRDGAEMIGFSEHPPLLPEDIWTAFRMEADQLDGYFDTAKKTREMFPGLQILTGFEMDLYPDFKNYYEDTFLHRKEIDYLIGGVHWIQHQGEWIWIQEARTASHLRQYFKQILGLLESGLCSFITHPDSFCLGYLKWDENAVSLSRDILSAAAEFKMPLEINGYGLRRPDIDTPDGPRKAYPVDSFWELASAYDVSVVFNSDAHRPEDVMANLDGCSEIAERYGLRAHPIQQQLSEALKETS